ncbi:hypothetical protein ACSU1N_06450 [Thermogladius sp. 4427co]
MLKRIIEDLEINMKQLRMDIDSLRDIIINRLVKDMVKTIYVE